MKQIFLVKIPSKTEFWLNLYKTNISVKLTIFFCTDSVRFREIAL